MDTCSSFRQRNSIGRHDVRRRHGLSCTCLLALFLTPTALHSACCRTFHPSALALQMPSQPPPMSRPPSDNRLTRRAFGYELATAAATKTATASAFYLAVLSSTTVPGGLERSVAATAEDDAQQELSRLRSSLLKARDQLSRSVPDLLQNEKWDSVRTLLSQPPLSDCWTATTSSSRSGGGGGGAARVGLLQAYAKELGETGGDELEALELRETLISHLRYLDMAVYNNVFNPITVQGTNGASAELVRSYYEDPANEYRASLSALQQLIDLSDSLVR